MFRRLYILSLFFYGALSMHTRALNTNEFPDKFLFGTATSAYQVEGAWNISGKGENIWDRYTHKYPENIRDNNNGDIACDSYHKFQEDLPFLENMKVHFYRFSLSWSRILPTGRAYKINPDGIRYYNQLIDLLLKNNIQPMITLFHWDTPQPLEDLGGFTNELMVDWFQEYARVAFEHFGSRVKLWITFNEPKHICLDGYGGTTRAPGYNFAGIADYICGHNILKAHAKVYHMYKNEYEPTQKGKISISLDSPWYEPKTNSGEDIGAAARMLGWFADPIFYPNGDYPQVMKDFISRRSSSEGFLRSRLPVFTQTEVEEISGTYDFFGLNHYTTQLAENAQDEEIGTPSFYKDVRVKTSYDDVWPGSASEWLKVVPFGFTNVLKWISNRYGAELEIYVTENGYSDNGSKDDSGRIDYHKKYLSALLDAVDEGVNVKAYTAWSFMDNFEWMEGYQSKFGLHHVDFNNPERPREAKASVEFYKKVITERKIPTT